MLDKFCCCCSLNTAGKFIGWIGFVFSLIAIVVILPVLGNLHHLEDKDFDQLPYTGEKVFIILIFRLILCLICAVASALLIVGTVKKRHSLLLPWLIFSAFDMFLLAISAIYTVITDPFSPAAAFMTCNILVVVFQCYVWYVIYSLYKSIEAENCNQQQLLLPPTTSVDDSYESSYTKESNNENV